MQSRRVRIFTGDIQSGALFIPDAHRTISNTDAGLRGFAAQVDTMHPALWLGEPTVQVISLTNNAVGGVGGPNQAETAVKIFDLTGVQVGDKGLRPSLVLAGDTNLDGVVNALDVQDAMDQLGTSPGQTGVMPVADQNGDGVVDLLDVALVLDGYGGTTDIYQGLWAPGRLMATVGGSAGFGSLPGGGVIGGSGLIGPGRRPNEDCLRDMPMDDGPGILPGLLRGDGRVNCLECPECYEPDPLDCYKCDEKGEIVGGEITATPEQPKPGDTVTFSWTPFTVEGRKRKCGPPCGGEETCDISLPPLGDSWVIELEGPPGVWTVVRSSEWGNSPTTTQSACAEIRFRLTSDIVGETENCAELGPKEEEKEVQFAEFTLRSECFADIPSDKQRTKIGVGESVFVKIVEDGVSALWTVRAGGTTIASDYGTQVQFQAPCESTTISVQAQSNSCTRAMTFQAVEPAGVEYYVIDTIQCSCRPGGGMVAEVHILPKDVSFAGLQYCEGEGTVDATGQEFDCHDGMIHDPTTDSWSIGEGNICVEYDYAWVRFCFRNGYDSCEPSMFVWPIPVSYQCGDVSKQFSVVTSVAWANADCSMTYSCGGAEVTIIFPSASNNCDVMNLDCGD